QATAKGGFTMAAVSLSCAYEGWEGYNRSLVSAISPRTAEELAFRPEPELRSAGEIAAHIALGRIDWFRRLDAPGSLELERTRNELAENRWLAEQAIAGDSGAPVRWLNESWRMVEDTLAQWTVEDLSAAYRHEYLGKVYAVSRQWTIWRIMAHDIHHGGQLSMLLYMQGISIPELGDLGGHLTEPPLASRD
ncbi:MAG TPA: DinB family protein, partial [Chthonomonadales bacterium]|nr:DinB family protein [Chthonomonadales bacterium]